MHVNLILEIRHRRNNGMKGVMITVRIGEREDGGGERSIVMFYDFKKHTKDRNI